MESGIYIIKNIVNDRFYLGATSNFDVRKRKHFKLLKDNKHHCLLLQKAFNKYGANSFVFQIIETCDKQILFEKEQSYFDKYGRLLYNSVLTSYEINQKARLKISSKMIGRKMSNETKEKLKNAMSGKKHSQETKLKISQKIKGQLHSLKSKTQIQLNSARKEILQLDENNNIIRKWLSISEAWKQTGIQHINHVCSGKRKTAGGFKWQFI